MVTAAMPGDRAAVGPTAAPEPRAVPARVWERARIRPGAVRGSLGSQVCGRLEMLIAAGELRPGDRLPAERELATRLGVSRASLREAMRDLEAKHLLERRPGRGTTVLAAPERVRTLYAGLSDAEHQLRDIAELRATVEPRLAELAAGRATATDLDQLERVLGTRVSQLAPEESLRLDLEFHQLVAHASGNPLMSSINTLVCSWTTATRVLSHATRYAREVSYLGHRAILDAMASGDGPSAREAMTRHLADVAELTRGGLAGREQT